MNYHDIIRLLMRMSVPEREKMRMILTSLKKDNSVLQHCYIRVLLRMKLNRFPDDEELLNLRREVGLLENPKSLLQLSFDKLPILTKIKVFERSRTIREGVKFKTFFDPRIAIDIYDNDTIENFMKYIKLFVIIKDGKRYYRFQTDIPYTENHDNFFFILLSDLTKFKRYYQRKNISLYGITMKELTKKN